MQRTLFHVSADITWTNLNQGVEFQDSVVTPQSQVTASVTAGQPILAGAAWARRAQAADTKNVAKLNVANTKRQVAFATADAFLTIITQRRLVEANLRALEVARAHFDLATELERQGMGSRLNALRAQQQVSTDEGLVEIARLGVYRAQEALGVLIAVDGPVDASDVPDFPGAAGGRSGSAAVAAAHGSEVVRCGGTDGGSHCPRQLEGLLADDRCALFAVDHVSRAVLSAGQQLAVPAARERADLRQRPAGGDQDSA